MENLQIIYKETTLKGKFFEEILYKIEHDHKLGWVERDIFRCLYELFYHSVTGDFLLTILEIGENERTERFIKFFRQVGMFEIDSTCDCGEPNCKGPSLNAITWQLCNTVSHHLFDIFKNLKNDQNRRIN